MGEPNLTERQRKWFDSVREGLERDTGKTLAQWVEIARACPETKHRARLKWFKETHGLLQNRASQVLGAAFEDDMSWNAPEALIDALWSGAEARNLFEAINRRISAMPDVTRTARKGYTAWSRKVQFAAMTPIKSGGAMFGLAVEPGTDPRLTPRRNDSWSERLTARMRLNGPDDLDPALDRLIEAAWSRA